MSKLMDSIFTAFGGKTCIVQVQGIDIHLSSTLIAWTFFLMGEGSPIQMR